MDNSFNFIITDNAAKKILSLCQSGENSYMRIAVDGGGCSGFKYDYSLEAYCNSDDIILEKNEAKVIIDKISQDFLNDCKLDYIETLGSSSFEISNPKATAKCGCGSSFSI